MLAIDQVCAQYDKGLVLQDVSVTVGKGELVCILGANGAGKTTLLKTIIGLLKPSKGTIRFENTRIDTLQPHVIVRSGISIIPEGRQLFPKMSILENLKIGADFTQNKAEFSERLEEISGLFPVVKERLHQLAGTLSGGEQAMVAICRGLVGNPKLLLMDEPSLGLAPKVLEEYFEVIARINGEKKVTVLLVEQNAKKALAISNRAYVLQKGEIILEGGSQSVADSDIVRNAYL
jgi:branched-chain amino acid transport system ATP-binding protein